jgi:hypothetical protein
MSEESAFDEMAEDLMGVNGLGVSAVFYPAVGDPVSLYVNLDQAYEGHPGGHLQVTSGYQKTVEYLLADIGRLALPNEEFVVSGSTYTVITPVDHDSGGRWVKVIVK